MSSEWQDEQLWECAAPGHWGNIGVNVLDIANGMFKATLRITLATIVSRECFLSLSAILEMPRV